MFGGNFQTWKLHSAQDYFMFFAYLLAGILVFWLIAKHMNKQRNHEKAVEKVSARLKRICGKPGEVLKNATLNLPEGKMTFDAVLMDKRGVYLVRTYGWGIKIYGTPDGAMWRREYAKRKEEFDREYCTNIVYLDLLNIEISSTLIRERVRESLEVKFFLPPGVVDIIDKYNLYRRE